MGDSHLPSEAGAFRHPADANSDPANRTTFRGVCPMISERRPALANTPRPAAATARCRILLRPAMRNPNLTNACNPPARTQATSILEQHEAFAPCTPNSCRHVSATGPSAMSSVGRQFADDSRSLEPFDRLRSSAFAKLTPVGGGQADRAATLAASGLSSTMATRRFDATQTGSVRRPARSPERRSALDACLSKLSIGMITYHIAFVLASPAGRGN